MIQLPLFGDGEESQGVKRYRPLLTIAENHKGVLDVDTVKGCSLGIDAYPNGGCYGECYAYKIAARYGIDFATSVSRKLTRSIKADIFFGIKHHHATWYRVGTAGDPSHDWDNTIAVLEELQRTGKTPVIITKHWIPMTDQHLERLRLLSAVINTSTSGMDTDKEVQHRVNQMDRIRGAGVKSVCRVVTCSYGPSAWGRACAEKQEYLMSMAPCIDTPLRASRANTRVLAGDILLTHKEESVGGGKWVSLHKPDTYLGRCGGCAEQCGICC